MKNRRWFSLEPERQLGRSLAEFMVRYLAPNLVNESRHLLSAARVTRILEQAYSLARAHKAQHGMGFLRRAIAAKSFKSSLEEAGYSNDFISVAVEGLIVELSRRGEVPHRN